MAIFGIIFGIAFLFYVVHDPMKALAMSVGWFLWLIPCALLMVMGAVGIIYGPVAGKYAYLAFGIPATYLGWLGVKNWVRYIAA